MLCDFRCVYVIRTAKLTIITGYSCYSLVDLTNVYQDLRGNGSQFVAKTEYTFNFNLNFTF